MATKKKKEIFFVREMPDDYEIDLDAKHWRGKRKLSSLLAASKKKAKHKKTA